MVTGAARRGGCAPQLRKMTGVESLGRAPFLLLQHVGSIGAMFCVYACAALWRLYLLAFVLCFVVQGSLLILFTLFLSCF